MKDIGELLKKNDKYKNTIIQRRLRSKKNTVAYVFLEGKPRILKWYAPGFKKQMEIEQSILIKGSLNLKIPFLYNIDHSNNVIIMNYIVGENLCDVINNKKTTFNENQRIMVLLANWFKQFHMFFKKDDQFYIRGDSILHNFILSENIWGVDFEETRLGKPVNDIASICSSIISTDPMFTHEKYQLCEKFITSYEKSVSWNFENITNELLHYLLITMDRRGYNLSLNKAKKIVNNIKL